MFRKTREKSPYFMAAVDFGYTLLAAVGVFGYIGWRLDHRFDTLPWFLLAGIGLGLAVGFNSLFRKLRYLETARREAERRRRQEGPDRTP